MADWKQIPDTDVDPDAPVTSELMYALRDNPVALAEGAVGAPRVLYPAINAVLQTGITSDNYVITNIQSRLFLLYGSLGVAGSGGSINVFIDFSSNNGSTWFGSTEIASGASQSSSLRIIPFSAIAGNPSTSVDAIRFRRVAGGGNQHQYNISVASVGSLM